MASVADGANFEAELSATQRELFTRAAAVRGLSVQEFVLAAAEVVAEEVIHGHEHIMLGASESRRLAELLENPPNPTEALRRAYRHYAQGEPA